MYIDKKINILNFIISFLPLSIILGNLAINVNVIIICILGFIIYGNKIWFIENLKFISFQFLKILKQERFEKSLN